MAGHIVPGYPVASEKMLRQRRIEQLALRGYYNSNELSHVFQVDDNTIATDMKEIRERWRKEVAPDTKDKLNLRIKQIEYIQAMAISAYEISRKQEEEYSIIDIDCDYPGCTQGIVKTPKGNDECEFCKGTGKRTIEVRKMKGEPGDPAFLNVAKACVVEVAKLEGLYPSSSGVLKKTTERELTSNSPDAVLIREKVEELYIEDERLIVQCLGTLDTLRQNAKSGNVKLLEIEPDKGAENE